MRLVTNLIAKITKTDVFQNSNIVNSFIEGSNTDANYTIGSITDLSIQKTKGTFDDFIFDLEASSFDKTKVTSINAFVFNDDKLTYSLNDTRFEVKIGGVKLCDTAQFALTNVDGLADNIVITGLASSSIDAEILAQKVTVYVIVTTK